VPNATSHGASIMLSSAGPGARGYWPKVWAMKHALAHLARRFGYEVQPLWRMARIAHVSKLRRVLETWRINTIIDVGANRGQFRDFLRVEVGFSGQIHSVEPISNLAKEMQARQSRDRDWFIHQIALGAEAGERDLHVMASDTFSSFLEPGHDLTDRLKESNTVVREERVQVWLLDDLVKEIAPLDLDRTFLKMDTQGFDLEVVRGGSRTLGEIPVLQSEVSVRPIYAGMPDLTTSLRTFEALGFGISDIFIVSEDPMLRAIEFDCLMVRADHGVVGRRPSGAAQRSASWKIFGADPPDRGR
jgi:FkbM family methyltransferase